MSIDVTIARNNGNNHPAGWLVSRIIIVVAAWQCWPVALRPEEREAEWLGVVTAHIQMLCPFLQCTYDDVFRLLESREADVEYYY
ncbi:hypothetical protein DdX_15061 [Ditylenchus destructor]|uniref:Uncharacterized protein n=1 Tax=Ditylenchus destructor TaxID=166010 RepID=A0AAD4MSU9_9BILA|nr:hypothetical protein DdX_15061 [Ditylenchus destructor]